METEQVAERFKQIRFNLQKSQMELANMLNVDQKRISRTEQGLQDLNGEFLTSMRKVLGLNINWLLFGEGEMFSETTGSSIETMPVYRMWTELEPFGLQKPLRKKAILLYLTKTYSLNHSG